MIAVKGSQYSRSNGDEAGTAGGVKSNVNMKATDWITYSFDVTMDGKNACRHTDKKFHNNQNTVDLAGNLDPAVAAAAEHDIKCAIQKCDKKDENGNDYDVSTTAADKPMPAGSQCSALGSKKHTCVKKTLEAKNPNCQCEKTFDMQKKPPTLHPPGAPRLPRGKGRRPDVVVGGGPPPTDYDVYDAKFPCSDAVKGGQTTGSMHSDMTKTGASKMSASQKRAYNKIANGGKVEPLSPANCASEPC